MIGDPAYVGTSDVVAAVYAGYSEAGYEAALEDPAIDAVMGTTGVPISAPVSIEVTAASGLTLSLQHFNGSDEAGTMPADEVGTVTWAASNASLEADAAHVKFGATGVHMDTGGATVTGSGITLDPSTSWTYEVFARGETTGKNAAGGACSLRDASSNVCMTFTVTPGPTNTFVFQVRDSGGSLIVNESGAVTTDATMKHRAVVYDGSSYQAYVEGVRIVNAAVATEMRTPDRILLSSSGSLNDGNSWDESRLSQDARYTGATLTVPSAEFTLD